jgi:hypothetical protein
MKAEDLSNWQGPPSEDGALHFSISEKGDAVTLVFDKSVRSITVSPEVAISIAQAFMEKALSVARRECQSYSPYHLESKQ